MKAKMKKRLLIYVGLLFPFCIQGANPVIADIPVRVVNTGKMAVAPNSSGQPTTMYVPHSMRMTGDTVSVVQAGVTATGVSCKQNMSETKTNYLIGINYY